MNLTIVSINQKVTTRSPLVIYDVSDSVSLGIEVCILTDKEIESREILIDKLTYKL